MRLAAVVRLVVEDVREDVGERLLVRRAAHREVCDRPCVGLLREALHKADEAPVLRRAGRGELPPVVVEDRVQPVRMIAFARKAPQPDPVGDEEIPTIAPLVAVEIKSNSNTYKDLRAKARKYLEHGTAMVWLVYPGRRFVEVYQANADDQVLFDTDMLDGGEVLPGFTLAVKELFRD